MSIWKDSNTSRQSAAPAAPEPVAPVRAEAPRVEAVPSPSPAAPARAQAERTRSESLIASDIMIEGKIEGAGSVRIAGKFKGDVNVQGDLTIEAGAKLTGAVRADKVIIAGELEGNVDGATLVNLLPTGVVTGDIKAGSLTVAAGARMRGQVEFGWEDGKGGKSNA